ncbi:MAG: NADH-quinone oxidoreductase subunit C [Coriobacteriales bacterium]
MKRFQTSTFIEAPLDQVVQIAAGYKERGWEFSQICATTLEDGVELLYAYYDPGFKAAGLDGVLVKVPDGASVPSITGVFPAAFVFENESHDLFGVSFEDISIDFGGEFYTVAVAYPMNPRAAACPAQPQEEEASDE